MRMLLQDLQYALRRLRKSPGFTITALLTLALGIGATTAIFTLVDDVLLKPLPYRNPEQLAVMEEETAEWRDAFPTLPMNANHFVFWREHSKTVQSMAIMGEASFPFGVGGHPLQVTVLRSTPGIFSVLAAAPRFGREFTTEDDQPGHDHVIVLLDDLWRREFQSDPHILGRTITLDGYQYTVIGVMPRSFHLPHMGFSSFSEGGSRPHPAEALVPLGLSKEDLQEDMGDFNYFGLARLRTGITANQANAEINTLQQAISAKLPADEKATLSAIITPFQKVLVGDSQRPLLILLAAVAGLLLVGCVNITNLLLARAVSRRRELAIAAALGADRTSLMRTSLREIAVIACTGAGLGILLANAILPAMQSYLPPALDFRGALHLDWTGVACSMGLALLAMLTAGVIPAWMSSQTGPDDVLRSEAHLSSESRNTRRLRDLLVAAEVATSVTLVLLTGLLVVSLSKLMHVDRGFEAEHVLTASIQMPANGYLKDENRFAFYKRALDQVSHLPGTQAASVVSVAPLNGDYWGDMARPVGDARPATLLPIEHFRWISPGYLESIHLPLVAGRTLSPSDEGKSFALVSELTARMLWPGKDPVGQEFTRGDPNRTKENSFTVIGVVKDARMISLGKPDPMMIYVPYWYRADSHGSVVVRTAVNPASMAATVQKAIWSVDPAVSVPTVRVLGGVVADSVANLRFEMNLLLFFAVAALLLAGLGVYGVVTYSVLQRQREIGLRLAIGAQASNVYKLVLRDGMMPVLIGAALGVAVSFASARLIGSLLFQVSPYSPSVAAGAVLLLLAIGVAGCLLPARRAASVDPVQALRSE
jgi:putative ABC transport system permease protein